MEVKTWVYLLFSISFSQNFTNLLPCPLPLYSSKMYSISIKGVLPQNKLNRSHPRNISSLNITKTRLLSMQFFNSPIRTCLSCLPNKAISLSEAYLILMIISPPQIPICRINITYIIPQPPQKGNQKIRLPHAKIREITRSSFLYRQISRRHAYLPLQLHPHMPSNLYLLRR